MSELADLVFSKSSQASMAGSTCPACKQLVYWYKVASRTSYSCSCGYQYFPIADTMFRKSDTELKHWRMAYQLIKYDKKVSAKNIQRVTGVTYKTAWRLRKLILENREEADYYLG